MNEQWVIHTSQSNTATLAQPMSWVWGEADWLIWLADQWQKAEVFGKRILKWFYIYISTFLHYLLCHHFWSYWPTSLRLVLHYDILNSCPEGFFFVEKLESCLFSQMVQKKKSTTWKMMTGAWLESNNFIINVIQEIMYWFSIIWRHLWQTAKQMCKKQASWRFCCLR